MALIITTKDSRATKLLDVEGVKYKIIQPVKTQTQIQQPFKKSDYILLEAKQHGSYSYPDIIVPFERTHFGERWIDCGTPTLLANEGGYMLTQRQFVDFLKLIKSYPASRHLTKT